MKEKYTPGEGCQCHAHSESECGCDVDWTPREVYELREQRDRLLEEREQWRLSSVCRELEEKLAKAKAKLEEVGFRACCVLLERDEAREQRDKLAEELKEAQNAIEMMLRDSSCRRIPAYTEEQLAAVKGGSHDH
jgi:DNA polymerase I-like protein with 3'-5' exonuclease and polymerase domains